MTLVTMNVNNQCRMRRLTNVESVFRNSEKEKFKLGIIIDRKIQ